MKAHSHRGRIRRWLWLTLASGVTIWALVLQAGPADAAPIGHDTALTGLTSQGFPSYFKISPNGKTVDQGHIALGLSCVSGDQLTFPDFVTHLRIDPGGRVQAGVVLPTTSVSGGGTYSGTDSMSAKVNRKRTQLTGVWRLQLSYAFPDGTTDQCDSGPVRFVDTL